MTDTHASKAPGVDIERLALIAASVITLLMVGAPIGMLFYGSFRTDAPGVPGTTFTLENWTSVYGGADNLAAFGTTIVLSAVVAGLSTLIGSVIAWIMARSDAPGRNFLAPLLVMPLMISTLITSLAWIALCAPNAGFVNAFARSWFGISMVFDIYSFSGVVLVLVLHFVSFAFLPIYAALRAIDASLEEASFMAGAGPLETAGRMTLPLIWPTQVASFLLIFIFVSENFSVPTLLGSTHGLRTLASAIYFAMASEPSKPTFAATAGTLLVWLALLGTAWQRRIIANARKYAVIGGKGAKPGLVRLGAWRYVATGFVTLYLLLAVFIPYATLVFASFLKFVTPRINMNLFTTANYARVFDWDRLLPTQNSLILSGAGALIATLAYVVLAYLISRNRGATGKVLEYAVMVPTVMPALVLGVGFVWAYVPLPLPIYGTMWILFIAYITRFAGQGVRQSRTALIQVSEDLSEASRICGASPAQTFRHIVLPLLRPALISLWTVLFILIFMEISITIVLYTPDTLTLPVLLWSRMLSGTQTEAFAVAVVQATIVFVILFLADRFFGTLKTTLSN